MKQLCETRKFGLGYAIASTAGRLHAGLFSMWKMRILFGLCRLLVGGALLLKLGGCAAVDAQAPAGPPAGTPATSAALVPEIKRLIGEASCTRTEDCRVIGVGARACGGPEGFWAWSVIETDQALLEAAVQRQAAVRRDELERLGERSTCDIAPTSRVTCQIVAGASQGRCAVLSGRLAN